MSFPRRVSHFIQWSKLMVEQATVPDRPQYKTTGKTRSTLKTATSGHGGPRRKKRRRRKRAKKAQD